MNGPFIAGGTSGGLPARTAGLAVFALALAFAARADVPAAPATPASAEITNAPPEMPPALPMIQPATVTNLSPLAVADLLGSTNVALATFTGEELLVHLKQRLELARYLRNTRQTKEAAPLLIELLGDNVPEGIRQSALLELAALSQDENDLARSQQIYAQFLSKWPNDLRIPEILLRQGLLFRRMGLYNMAFTKFYGVMTSALTLKNDQFDYYVRLVLQAQTEIAQTHYELGKYSDAAEFFTRLLKQDNPSINKPLLLFQLVRCQAAVGHYAEAVASAQDFLLRFPESPELPEVRFHLALSLKELGRNNESLQQVFTLLKEQRELTKNRPEVWAYWQQRTGNLIANQLYREGDYPKALDIYLSLVQLDASPAWQVPVNYQVGMTYERLWQPQKATEVYNGILQREKDLGTNAPPNLKTVFDMARWRVNFIDWQVKAEAANRRIRAEIEAEASAKVSSPSSPIVIP